MTALYTSGTISLVNGSAVITGIDTAWKTALIVGGTVHVEAEGNPLPILADDSAGASEHPITDTQMTAAIKWQGATGTYKYALVRENTYTEAQAANSVKIAELLQRLNHPTIAAIAGVQGEQDHLILLTGASTATIIPRTSLIQGIEANATVETPAGLVTYESEAAGFIVLVADAGGQRAALYFKVSATAGDWSDPAFLTGEKGNQGDIGPTGITWRGVWNNVAAYAKNDVVQNNKSAWIALRANTNVAPPVLPTTANADWELFARAGVDGTGIGDVVGPSSVTAGNLAQFSDNTGKVIGRATIGSPALLGRLSSGAGDVERLTKSQASQVLGGWEPIGKLDLTGVSGGEVPNLSPFTFIRCLYSFQNPTTPGDCYLQVSVNNGSSWYSTVGDYRFNILYSQYAGGVSSVQHGDGDLQGISLGGYLSSGEVIIGAFNKAAPSQSVCTQMVENPTSRTSRIITHRLPGAAARNAIRVVCPSNNTRAEFYFEGIRG
ncbi:hypothetical protein G6M16_006975 [Agrobacterium tumefaciens]|nr:hypothetical protein G6M16_006975 [Agrobacterium tumefaciens]